MKKMIGWRVHVKAGEGGTILKEITMDNQTSLIDTVGW